MLVNKRMYDVDKIHVVRRMILAGIVQLKVRRELLEQIAFVDSHVVSWCSFCKCYLSCFEG
jgi:hypothetical protein